MHNNHTCYSYLQFVFLTGGIVFLTLIVNGSTTQFVLHHLNLDKLTAAKVTLFLFSWCLILQFLNCKFHGYTSCPNKFVQTYLFSTARGQSLKPKIIMKSPLFHLPSSLWLIGLYLILIILNKFLICSQPLKSWLLNRAVQ